MKYYENEAKDLVYRVEQGKRPKVACREDLNADERYWITSVFVDEEDLSSAPGIKELKEGS